MPIDKRVASCLLLSKVLVADGMMTENERAFLDATMRRMSLDADERRRVVELEGWDEAESAIKVLPEDERQEVLRLVMDAAAADGRLSPLEVKAVAKIRADLGLDR